jgi:hypothetical protein
VCRSVCRIAVKMVRMVRRVDDNINTVVLWLYIFTYLHVFTWLTEHMVIEAAAAANYLV